MKPDRSPETDYNSIDPKQQPPSKADYYLAGDKDYESYRKNSKIHLAENIRKLFGSLATTGPDYSTTNPDGDYSNAQD